MQDALLVIDVFNDFDHPNGDALLASFHERKREMVEAIATARSDGIPVIYVNDQHGRWDADASGLVQRAIAKGGGLIAALAPRPGEAFVLKPRYSAFDHTPLVLLLRELQVERILLVGAATEGCIVQSGIDARELGFKVTILAHACATNDPKLEEIALRYAEQVGGMRIAHSTSAQEC
jgi:nicotinamidase-related amidase